MTNNYGHQDVTRTQVYAQILSLYKRYDSPEKRKRVMLSFSGGEPTLNKYLLDYIRFAKKIGIGCIQIQTNGSMLFVKKQLLLDLIDAGLDEVFLAQHSHLDEINKELGVVYRIDDFIKWVKFICEEKLHEKVKFCLNIVVTKINLPIIKDFLSFLKEVGYLGILKLQGDNTISLGLVQPNGYALDNAQDVLLKFDEEDNAHIDDIVENCKSMGFFADFHFTAPPVCIIGYPEHNLELQRMKKVIDDEEKGVLDAENRDSYSFLWKEKRKLAACQQCEYDKFCLGFYKNWLEFVGESYVEKRQQAFLKKNIS